MTIQNEAARNLLRTKYQCTDDEMAYFEAHTLSVNCITEAECATFIADDFHEYGDYPEEILRALDVKKLVDIRIESGELLSHQFNGVGYVYVPQLGRDIESKLLKLRNAEPIDQVVHKHSLVVQHKADGLTYAMDSKGFIRVLRESDSELLGCFSLAHRDLVGKLDLGLLTSFFNQVAELTPSPLPVNALYSDIPF